MRSVSRWIPSKYVFPIMQMTVCLSFLWVFLPRPNVCMRKPNDVNGYTGEKPHVP